jgi:hypothetical protein
MLADATWQSISWRTGTKGKLKARFAAIRVRCCPRTAIGHDTAPASPHLCRAFLLSRHPVFADEPRPATGQIIRTSAGYTLR